MITYIALFGASFYLYFALRMTAHLIFLGAAWMDLPLYAIRILLLCLKSSVCAITLWFALSFKAHSIVAMGLLIIFALGIELWNHERKRTTAAYSTSDSQNQRLFNLSALILVFTAILIGLGNTFGISPVDPIIPETVMRWSESAWMQIIWAFGCYGICRYGYATFRHRRTLSYLADSYIKTIREGKIKRLW